MASLAELEGALVKADAAGDVEAARAFAGEIRRLRTVAPTEAPAAPEQSTWEAIKPYAMPVAEGVGAAAGGILGGLGGVAAFPVLGPAGPAAGAVAGSGLGYAGVKELERLADQRWGGKAPATGRELVTDPILNVGTGAAYEMGGQALGNMLPSIKALWDKRVQQRANKMLNEVIAEPVAGGGVSPTPAQIKAALSNSPKGLTAGQVVAEAGINAPTFQAAGKYAEGRLPGAFTDVADAQTAARAASLQSVTPNKQTAEQTRDMVSNIMYDRVRAVDAARIARIKSFQKAQQQLQGTGASVTVPPMMPPEIASLRRVSPIQSAILAAERTVKGMRSDLKNPMDSFEGLEAMKRALDSRIKEPNVDNPLKALDSTLVGTARQQLIEAMEKVHPLYGQARGAHARLSGPVNQASVLDDLQNVLRHPANTGERAGPFLNAMSTGAGRLLKRSGVPRYQRGGIDQVLNQNQMAVANRVQSELQRDAGMAGQATAGRQRFTDVMGKYGQDIPAPNLLDAKYTMVKRALNVMSGRLNEKALTKLSEAMLSGRSTMEILDMVPSAHRQALLKAMQQHSGTAGASVNMMTPDYNAE